MLWMCASLYNSCFKNEYGQSSERYINTHISLSQIIESNIQYWRCIEKAFIKLFLMELVLIHIFYIKRNYFYFIFCFTHFTIFILKHYLNYKLGLLDCKLLVIFCLLYRFWIFLFSPVYLLFFYGCFTMYLKSICVSFVVFSLYNVVLQVTYNFWYVISYTVVYQLSFEALLVRISYSSSILRWYSLA